MLPPVDMREEGGDQIATRENVLPRPVRRGSIKAHKKHQGSNKGRGQTTYRHARRAQSTHRCSQRERATTRGRSGSRLCLTRWLSAWRRPQTPTRKKGDKCFTGTNCGRMFRLMFQAWYTASTWLDCWTTRIKLFYPGWLILSCNSYTVPTYFRQLHITRPDSISVYNNITRKQSYRHTASRHNGLARGHKAVLSTRMNRKFTSNWVVFTQNDQAVLPSHGKPGNTRQVVLLNFNIASTYKSEKLNAGVGL